MLRICKKMGKDWTGNKATTFSQLGTSYLTKKTNPDRGFDYYASPPEALEDLLRFEEFGEVWECADGEGNLCGVLRKRGILGRHSDLIDRGCGEGGVDFLLEDSWRGDIITNPPYKYALSFVRHALRIIPEGRKVAMLLKIQFLEGKSRREFFRQNPPKTVYVWSKRIKCAFNNEFGKSKEGGAIMFAWFVWVKGFRGDPTIKWLD